MGKADSDESLLEARLWPLKRTARLTGEEMERLYEAGSGSRAPSAARRGRLLRDRALSRLGEDWPKSLEELERR